jgi:hypothetical protein
MTRAGQLDVPAAGIAAATSRARTTKVSASDSKPMTRQGTRMLASAGSRSR